MRQRNAEGAFTLVELLVVVIIIGILAAIAIPRLLNQRERANDATAVSDLRNLIVVETGLEATSTGLTDDPSIIADQDWRGTNDRIRACAELLAGGTDITLTAWHLDGSLVYSYTRSVGVLQSNDVPAEETCVDQVGPAAATVWPHP